MIMLISVGKMFVTESRRLAFAVASVNGFTLPSKLEFESVPDVGLVEELKSAFGLHMEGI
jgi:hypothetical protein